MNLIPSVAINFGVNGFICYVIGRKLRNHQTGMWLGLIGAIVSMLTALYIGIKAEDPHD